MLLKYESELIIFIRLLADYLLAVTLGEAIEIAGLDYSRAQSAQRQRHKDKERLKRLIFIS
uniref:Uncharacterized protein n=1 Tax=uncultured Desulfobacterium sp. TaxID=201089 RepID=E1YBF6_9BACT|nr:unknown protein [uncultured Desulfobacterium sp.]